MADKNDAPAEPTIPVRADDGTTENPQAETVDVPPTEVMFGEPRHPDAADPPKGATGDNDGYPAQPGVPPDGQVAAADDDDEPKRRGRPRKAT